MSEKGVKFFRGHPAITEDFQHEARSYYFSSMDGNDSNATVRMPQKIVASFHARDLESCCGEGADDLFSGKSRETAHDATRIVCTPTKSRGSRLSP